LRRQTQIRVVNDLGGNKWHKWTSEDQDFRKHTDATPILQSDDLMSLAVVKKNASRLRALRDWLREVPDDVLARTPILLIDDEADQASPNTAKGFEHRRGINKLITEILKEIKSGTYIGYTATPFANVFMDP